MPATQNRIASLLLGHHKAVTNKLFYHCHTLPHQSVTITKKVSAQIYSCIRGLKDSDSHSVLEFLYAAYADEQGQDPQELKQYFIALDDHLQVLSLKENNEIFAIVCSICSAYEKRAFLDGIQVGACLVLELQGN